MVVASWRVMVRFKRIVFLFLCLVVNDSSFAAKIFKIEYTTQQVESLEQIVAQFVATADESSKMQLSEDIKKRNSQVADWSAVPVNTTLVIFISEQLMSNEELTNYVAKEEQRRVEGEAKKLAEAEAQKNNFALIEKRPNRHAISSGYSYSQIKDTNEEFITNSIVIPSMVIHYDFTHLHNLKKWKIEDLAFTYRMSVATYSASDGLEFPVSYNLKTEVAWVDAGIVGFYPYLSLGYSSFPYVTQIEEDVPIVIVESVLNSGLGISYRWIVNRFRILLMFEYLLDLSASGKLEEGGGDAVTLSGSETRGKLRLEWAFITAFSQSIFFDVNYFSFSRSGDVQDISGSGYLLNAGISF